MRKHQAGITFIGWVLLLVPVAIVAYSIIRLVPIYLTHVKVSKAVEQVAEEYSDRNVNPGEVRAAIARRLDIESVAYPTMDQISVARGPEGWAIEASYERTAGLFGGIALLVTFDKRVPIQ